MCKDNESRRDYETRRQQVFQFIIHNAQLKVFYIKKRKPENFNVLRFSSFKMLSFHQTIP